jgi:hypothetical protein
MVSANDNNGPRGKSGKTPGPRSATSRSATCPAEAADHVTCAKDRPGETTSAIYNIYTKVTDDFGEHVEVRRGELVLLGEIIPGVLAKLRPANDR